MKVADLKIGNINKPTNAKWSKIAAILALAAGSLSALGGGTDTHLFVWAASFASFLSSAILILINGNKA